MEIIPPGAEAPVGLSEYLSDLASGRDDVPRLRAPAVGKFDWVPRFLHALRNNGNIRIACQAAGVARSTVKQYRARSQRFARQWDEAMDDFSDSVEAMVLRRAKTSDLLLMFLAKKVRPEYRDNYDPRKEATATFWQGANGDRAMSIQIKWPDKAIADPGDADDFDE